MCMSITIINIIWQFTNISVSFHHICFALFSKTHQVPKMYGSTIRKQKFMSWNISDYNGTFYLLLWLMTFWCLYECAVPSSPVFCNLFMHLLVLPLLFTHTVIYLMKVFRTTWYLRSIETNILFDLYTKRKIKWQLWFIQDCFAYIRSKSHEHKFTVYLNQEHITLTHKKVFSINKTNCAIIFFFCMCYNYQFEKIVCTFTT